MDPSSVLPADSTAPTGQGAWGLVLERCVRLAADLAGCDRFELWRRDGPHLFVRAFEPQGPGTWSAVSERPAAGTGFSASFVDVADAVRRCSAGELDLGFDEDARLLADGIRSLCLAPLRGDAGPEGVLCLASRRENAFAPENDTAILPLADLVTSILVQERIGRLQRQSHATLEALDPLLSTLGTTLDLREVFAQVSRLARDLVPHDFMCLDFIEPDRSALRTFAFTEGVADDPREMPIAAEMRAQLQASYLIGLDVAQPLAGETVRVLIIGDGIDQPTWFDIRFDGLRRRVIEQMGLRSALRVAIRLRGEIVGGLEFASRSIGRYSVADVPVARRIASCVAMAVAHQRLVEGERRAAAARERARRLEVRVATLQGELDSRGAHRPVGTSKKWRDVLEQATKVAATEATVLLTGESGTGKEVLARLIHRNSPRGEQSFVALNCAALPENLLESELFGHEKGAFTGALNAHAGRIEQAAGGVLFLDEVGEMSPNVQAKFLRVLQEREFQRLGGTRTQKADVRVVAATNRDLARAMARGEFRPDLYYRLHVFEIRSPPLRERPEDILPLVEHFLQQIGAEVGRPAAGISRQARDKLLAHAWPGNVRELRNALERAVILCDGGLINLEHLPIALDDGDDGGLASASPLERPANEAAEPPEPPSPGARLEPFTLPPQGLDLEALERDLIRKALERAGDNKSKAARLLGLTRAQLYSRIEKHRLL